MKLKKNQIVFMSVLAVVLIFIIAYSVWIFGSGKKDSQEIPHTELPDADLENLKEYSTRMEAVDDLQENRERMIPSVYNENLLDSLGYYHPQKEEEDKKRLLDSIFNNPHTPSEPPKQKAKPITSTKKKSPKSKPVEKPSTNEVPDFGAAHQDFFRSAPKRSALTSLNNKPIPAVVDGEQVVQNRSRLRLRLQKDFKIKGELIPRNTLVYGIVTLQPNRLLLKIENIGPHPVDLSVLDAEDHREGIYIENNLRSQVQKEIGQSTLGTVNVPGVPAVSRIGHLFRRNIHREKVTLLNHYQVLLQKNQ